MCFNGHYTRTGRIINIFVPKNPSAAATVPMAITKYALYYYYARRGGIRSGLPKTAAAIIGIYTVVVLRETLAGHNEFRFSKNRNRRRTTFE